MRVQPADRMVTCAYGQLTTKEAGHLIMPEARKWGTSPVPAIIMWVPFTPTAARSRPRAAPRGCAGVVMTEGGHVSPAAVTRFHRVISHFPNYAGYPNNMLSGPAPEWASHPL